MDASHSVGENRKFSKKASKNRWINCECRKNVVSTWSSRRLATVFVCVTWTLICNGIRGQRRWWLCCLSKGNFPKTFDWTWTTFAHTNRGTKAGHQPSSSLTYVMRARKYRRCGRTIDADDSQRHRHDRYMAGMYNCTWSIYVQTYFVLFLKMMHEFLLNSVKEIGGQPGPGAPHTIDCPIWIEFELLKQQYKK